MKKIIMLSVVSTLVLASAAFAELRPTQVLMQARAGWVKEMNGSLQKKDFNSIAKNASELAAQTEGVSKKLDGEKQQLTRKVSLLAKEVESAAKGKNASLVQTKLGEIKGTCATCHEKYRKN